MEYGMEYGICYCKLKIMFHSLFGFGGLLFFLEVSTGPETFEDALVWENLWKGHACNKLASAGGQSG